MDNTYKAYVVPGGITYLGPPVGAKAYAGKERILLKWASGPDPKVTKTRVYWNNFTDSLEVRNDPGKDSVSVYIDDLSEQNYSFFLQAYDDEGNSSIRVEVLGKVLGERYERNLLNRGLNRASLHMENGVSLNWGLANTADGAFATELVYKNREGDDKSRFLPTKEEISIIEDYEPGTLMRYRTVYVPDSLSIDTFYTAFQSIEEFFLEKNKWKIIAFNSQHGGTDNQVINLIDGNDQTRWHTDAGASTYPHFVTLDVGEVFQFSAFSLYRTTFGGTGDDRGPDEVSVSVSADNMNWIDLGNFTFNRFIDGEQKFVLNQTVLGRYIKLTGVRGPQPYMVLGELDVYVK